MKAASNGGAEDGGDLVGRLVGGGPLALARIVALARAMQQRLQVIGLQHLTQR